MLWYKTILFCTISHLQFFTRINYYNAFQFPNHFLSSYHYLISFQFTNILRQYNFTIHIYFTFPKHLNCCCCTWTNLPVTIWTLRWKRNVIFTNIIQIRTRKITLVAILCQAVNFMIAFFLVIVKIVVLIITVECI